MKSLGTPAEQYVSGRSALDGMAMMERPALQLRFGNFILDLARSALLHEGRCVSLRRQAFDTLRHLVERRGHVSAAPAFRPHKRPSKESPARVPFMTRGIINVRFRQELENRNETLDYRAKTLGRRRDLRRFEWIGHITTWRRYADTLLPSRCKPGQRFLRWLCDCEFYCINDQRNIF